MRPNSNSDETPNQQKSGARSCEVHTIPGDHTTIHGEPHVHVLVKLLRAGLAKADSFAAR